MAASSVTVLSLVVLMLVIPLNAFVLKSKGNNVCTSKRSYTSYYPQSYTTSCGTFNWNRCTRYRQKSRQSYRTNYYCCTGWSATSSRDCNTALCHGLKYGVCANGGTCKKPDVCECPTGYEPPKCDDVNECSDNNGGCDHICTNTPGSFTCQCRDGYDLMEDERSCEAVCYGGLDGECPNGGTCLSPNNCTCAPGYEPPECEDTDECEKDTHDCDHICENDYGSFGCYCEEDYELLGDGKSCQPLCHGHPNGTCQNGGTCVEPDVCSCPDGYAPPACADINECIAETSPCQQNCENTDGSYVCHCELGFALQEDNTTCKDIDECLAGTHSCADGCENTNGSFVCTCSPGFSLQDDERSCEDVNECIAETSPCQQNCDNTNGSYVCVCELGFDLQDDGITCKDIDECLAGAHSCSEGCENTNGSFVCTCNPGFSLQDDERSCEDVNECLLETSPCSQVCGNTNGSYVCSCEPGFHLREDKATCSDYSISVCLSGNDSTACPMCIPGPGKVCSCPEGLFISSNGRRCSPPCMYDLCLNGGECMELFGNDTTETVVGFDCKCNGTGFIGQFCEIDPMVIANQTKESANTSETTTVLPTTTTFLTEDLDEIVEIVASCALNLTASYNETSPPSVRAPGSVVADTGKAFKKIKLNVTSSQPTDIQICAEEGVVVRPAVIKVEPSEQETVFEISSERRGLFLVVVIQPGTIDPLATIEVQFDDVYKRLQLTDEALPRGYHNLDIKFRDTQFRFASTSPWCTLANENLHITKGTVWSVAGEDALPVGFPGVEVSVGKELSIGRISSLRSYDGCRPTEESSSGIRTKRNFEEQILRHFNDEDVDELLEKQAVLGSVFKTLRSKLPLWIRFELNETKGGKNDEATVQILSGFKAQRLPSCFGAPLNEHTMYHVYRFSQGFRLKYFSLSILPNLENGEEYCLIVDLNQDYGGTFVLLFPRPLDVVSPLSNFKHSYYFLNLFEFATRSFGISFPGNLNGHRRPLGELRSINHESYYLAEALTQNPAESVTLWNGDTTFSYPTQREINTWFTTDTAITFAKEGLVQFTVETTLEAMISIPDFHEAYEQFLTKPWDVNIRSVSGFKLIIKVWIAGKSFSIDLNNIGTNLFAIDVFGYMSVAGRDYERVYCGSSANPPGIFFEANVNGQLLRGIPYLQDKVAELTFSSADAKIQFFKIYDEDVVLEFGFSKFEAVLKTHQGSVGAARKLVRGSLARLRKKARQLIGNDLKEIARAVSFAYEDLGRMIDLTKQKNLYGLNDEALRAVSQAANKARAINERVETSYIRGLRSMITKIVKKLDSVDASALTIYVALFEQPVSMLKQSGSWGIRGRLSIKIAGDLYALQGYFIQADKVASRCGIYSKYFDHLRGESSIRVFGKVEFPIYILPKVKIDVGFGVEVAIGQTSSKFVVRLHATAKYLGFKLTLDVFVNNKGLHSVFLANIYDIFRARVTMSANVFVPHDKRYALLRVEFMPGGDGFEGSFIDVFKNYVKKKAQDAYKRIQSAQNKIDSAKRTVTKAQRKIERAKRVLDRAQRKMDRADSVLERAKDKVEAAKGPFRKAMNALNKAQRRVDRLCTIKTCHDICIPGVKFKMCKKGWFPYPCFKFTSCMIRIPNPVCIIKNAACYIIRGAAYAALSFAKVAVHLPMRAMDLAKVALGVAQVAVRVAQGVLTAAKGAMNVAVVALDVAKVAMNFAKAGLEVVKIAVRIGYMLFEFIVDFGLKSLIDVKTCGFEVLVATKEGVEFEVFCNVNPLKKGWRMVGFRINFTNILSSLWNAVKSMASKFLSLLKNAFGRRKREVPDDILATLGRIVRHRRDTNQSDSSFSDIPLDGEFFQNGTLVTNVSWEHDTQFWEERCSEFEPAYQFLKVAIETLYNASVVVTKQVEEARALSKVDVWESQDESGSPLGEGEIDFDIALSDFNITREELLKVIREANVSNNVITQESKNATDFVVQQNDETTEAMSEYDLITLWKTELHNISTQTFTHDQCTSHHDCLTWCFIQLSDVVSSVDSALVPQANETLAELEFVMYDLLDSVNRSVSDVQNSSSGALELLARLDFMDIFCGTAPSVLQHPMNGTVLLGGNFSMSCHGVGVPSPNYYWYKNDELYMYGTDTLVFTNVSLSDEANYTCVVGNHIQNVSTQDASLLVVYPPRIVSQITPYVEFVTGDNIKIACKTDGKPRAVTHWNTTSGIIHNATGDILYLDANNSLPSGLYSCKSFNEYGWDMSEEILVDVKATYPTCPSTTVQVGFISTSGEQSQSFTFPGDLFENLFTSAVSLIVLNDRVNISVEVLEIDDSLGEVTLAVEVVCVNTTECIRQVCNDHYNNMTRHLQGSLTSLQQAVAEEKFLFSIGDLKYYFNRALFDIGQIMPTCPKNYTQKLETTCVYADQFYHIPGPRGLQLLEGDKNITVLWEAPRDLGNFLQDSVILPSHYTVCGLVVNVEDVDRPVIYKLGYTMLIVLHDALEKTYHINISSLDTSWALDRLAFFELTDTTYSVRLRAFTESQHSPWEEQTMKLTSSQQQLMATDVTFGVLMGVLFTTLTALAIMVAVYRLKTRKSSNISSAPPPPYTERETSMHLSDMKKNVDKPQSAWL